MQTFEKRRDRAAAGSIPDVLDMFVSEVRFYREVAPVVGVRVPVCLQAEASPQGTRLVLEDLSAWALGGDPVAVARELAGLHERWRGQAQERWPWLRRPGKGADLIAALFDRTWPSLEGRSDLPPSVRSLGRSLVGRLEAAERAEGTAGPLTLCHGDASLRNVFTHPGRGGEVAFVDWEDVSCAPGAVDLAWLLVSSVAPGGWDEVIAAYGEVVGLEPILPSAAAQGLFSLSDCPEGSPAAEAWVERLNEAAARIWS